MRVWVQFGAENETEVLMIGVGVCFEECVHITSTSFDTMFPPKAIFHGRWKLKRLKSVHDTSSQTQQSVPL